MKGFIAGIPIALLAVAAQAMEQGATVSDATGAVTQRGSNPQYGNTVIGGPTGNDEGQVFDMSMIANIQTDIDEYAQDDHSINIKETQIGAPPAFHPSGPHGGMRNPFEKRGEKKVGGTVIGGPSSDDEPFVHGATVIGGPTGNDPGQTFSAPVSVNVATSVKEHYVDDHSIDVDEKNIYLPPHFPSHGGHGPAFAHGGPSRRAYSPDRDVDDSTVMGGPTGNDEGSSFFHPTSVGVDSNVDENHQDDHSVDIDSTTVHAPQEDVPQMPWMPYKDNTPVSHPGPIPAGHSSDDVSAQEPEYPSSADPTEHTPQGVDAAECSAQTHEVVHTVTMTEYKEVQSTVTVYATPVESHMMQTSSWVPSPSYMPNDSDVEDKSWSPSSAPSSSYDYTYDYPTQTPQSSVASYSVIPVHVPLASSHGMMAAATPSGSYAMPSGADGLRHPSGTPSGSVTPSAYMFEGSAGRVSGGFVSVAAAFVGVLAFVL
ncbi:hypothetical protein POX_b02484 [Penicillium oxalicum]|uniref:hypothetical protein n=1 Tax=Penicillium oxalicum TaxID=69781 RepID=UPI0020B73433|nr:hypothetical protein POX_b02484 [Penicillium oxalicum]KAI2792446.1 hypothetical protein POX_b02484 [Penicillium oxalicum]